MERLWKGRSAIYGTEGVPAAPLRPNIKSDSRPTTITSADIARATSIPSMTDSPSPQAPAQMQAQAQTQNHSYFVVQAPYQPQHAATYPAYGGIPPPPMMSMYPAAVAAAGQEHLARQQPPPAMHPRAFSDGIAFAKMPDLPAPRSNPLPDPPRLSTYRPAPLPPSLAN